MGVGTSFCMYGVVVKKLKFTLAISSLMSSCFESHRLWLQWHCYIL